MVPVIDWWEAERIARRRLLGRRRSQTYRLRRAAQREASAADNGLSADLVEGSRQEGGWQGEWPDEETIDPYEPSSFGFTEVRSRRTG